MTEPPGRGMALHTKILIGLVLGAIGGTLSNLVFKGTPQLMWLVDNVLNPIGQVFLRMLFMVVVPLVFTSVALGVASLGDPRRIGRIGARTEEADACSTSWSSRRSASGDAPLEPGM